MEINYELIIKYLVKKDIKKDNTFITQKNIHTYVNTFPDVFKNLLTDKFYRYGITVYDKNKNNISFWSSLLTLIDNNFIMPYENEEITMINSFKNQLVEKHKKSNKNFDKFELKERLKLEPDEQIIQYVIDNIDINLFVFDFDTNEISVMYRGDEMNTYKKYILLAKSKNFWEPIMCIKAKNENIPLFNHSDNVIKKILASDIKYFNNTKKVKFADLNDIINNEKKKLKVKNIDDIKINNEEICISDNSEASIKTDEECLFIKEELDNLNNDYKLESKINLESETESDSKKSKKSKKTESKESSESKKSKKTKVESKKAEPLETKSETKKINKTLLKKSKVAELVEFLDKYEIKYNKTPKLPTREKMIEMIVSKLNL